MGATGSTAESRRPRWPGAPQEVPRDRSFSRRTPRRRRHRPTVPTSTRRVRGTSTDDQVAEGLALVEGDPAPLAQLEQGEEAHDDLHPGGAVRGELAERQPALARAGARRARLTASDTVTASTVTWDRSSRNSGRGTVPTRKAAARCSGVTPASRSGARSRKRSSSPADRGSDRAGLVDEHGEGVGGGRVGLELEEPGQQAVALLEAGQLLVVVDVVGPGQELAGLELDQDGGDHQELGGGLEVEGLAGRHLGDEGVDEVRHADVVDVDLVVRDRAAAARRRALRRRASRRAPPRCRPYRLPRRCLCMAPEQARRPGAGPSRPAGAAPRRARVPYHGPP